MKNVNTSRRPYYRTLGRFILEVGGCNLKHYSLLKWKSYGCLINCEVKRPQPTAGWRESSSLWALYAARGFSRRLWLLGLLNKIHILKQKNKRFFLLTESLIQMQKVPVQVYIISKQSNLWQVANKAWRSSGMRTVKLLNCVEFKTTFRNTVHLKGSWLKWTKMLNVDIEVLI